MKHIIISFLLTTMFSLSVNADIKHEDIIGHWEFAHTEVNDPKNFKDYKSLRPLHILMKGSFFKITKNQYIYEIPSSKTIIKCNYTVQLIKGDIITLKAVPVDGNKKAITVKLKFKKGALVLDGLKDPSFIYKKVKQKIKLHE